MPTPKLRFTDTLAERQMRRIRTFCAAHHGATSELVRRYSEITRQPTPRSTFTRWLHPDPKERMQPALGSYLLMERIVTRMQREKKWQPVKNVA